MRYTTTDGPDEPLNVIKDGSLGDKMGIAGKLLEETKPEECEKFNFLKEEIEKIVQRKAMLGLAAGKDLLSKTYKSAPNKNKIIPSGVQ